MPFTVQEIPRAHILIEEALIEIYGHVPSIFVVVDITDQLDMDRELMSEVDAQFSPYDIFYAIRNLIFHVSPMKDRDNMVDGDPVVAAIRVLDAFGRGDEVDPAFRQH